MYYILEPCAEMVCPQRSSDFSGDVCHCRDVESCFCNGIYFVPRGAVTFLEMYFIVEILSHAFVMEYILSPEER